MEGIERSLRSSGWHLKPDIMPQIWEQLREDPSSFRNPYEAAVSQLLDADLKDVCSPCLPDSSTISRISKLQGPLILQVVSVRNICQSNSDSFSSTAQEQHRRLLRIYLTDGHSAVSAIEYRAMPNFSLNTPPGTKVKVGNVIPVQNAILLGDADSIIILGGHVQDLYEAWEIQQKHSGLASIGLPKTGRHEGSDGPPPFHGLHVTKNDKPNKGKQTHIVQQQLKEGHHNEGNLPVSSHKSWRQEDLSSTSRSTRNDAYPESSSDSVIPTSDQSERRADLQKDQDKIPDKIDGRADAIKAAIALASDTVPLQNRAAAQRLLERRKDGSAITGDGRGRGTRGRGRRDKNKEEVATLTLDEWEATKIRPNVLNEQRLSADDDEALAWKLHHQLNVDDGKRTTSPGKSDVAEQIRQSMFSFSGDKSVDEYGSMSSHHGKARGRGRGRGRRR